MTSEEELSQQLSLVFSVVALLKITEPLTEVDGLANTL